MATSKSTSAPAPAPTPATSATPTPLEIAVKGMDASVDAINKAVAKEKTDSAKESVRVNVLHLEYSLGTDLIKTSKTDTKVYTDAIAAGKAFLA